MKSHSMDLFLKKVSLSLKLVAVRRLIEFISTVVNAKIRPVLDHRLTFCSAEVRSFGGTPEGTYVTV